MCQRTSDLSALVWPSDSDGIQRQGESLPCLANEKTEVEKASESQGADAEKGSAGCHSDAPSRGQLCHRQLLPWLPGTTPGTLVNSALPSSLLSSNLITLEGKKRLPF